MTALCISPSGNLIASGQGSSTCVPNSEAMVIVWDWKTRQSIYRLIELNDGIAFSRNRVRQIAFSPDDMFLSASDDQPGGAKLCVWHTHTGQLATITKLAQRQLAENEAKRKARGFAAFVANRAERRRCVAEHTTKSTAQMYMPG